MLSTVVLVLKNLFISCTLCANVAEPVRQPWHDMCKAPLLSFGHLVVIINRFTIEIDAGVMDLTIPHHQAVRRRQPACQLLCSDQLTLQEVKACKGSVKISTLSLIPFLKRKFCGAVTSVGELVVGQWFAHRLFIT